MPYFYSERIRLRAAEKDDISIFLRWINDPEVTENLMLAFPMSRFEEEQWYENMMSTPPNEHVMAIEVKPKNQGDGYLPIGTCQFMSTNWRHRSTEIGIMIGEKAHWDQGYGTETLKLMLDHGFKTLNLHRIWLQVFEKNERAIHAYQKTGFTHEGKYRQAHFQHGRYYDIHLMNVLKDEWQQQTQ